MIENGNDLGDENWNETDSKYEVKSSENENENGILRLKLPDNQNSKKTKKCFRKQLVVLFGLKQPFDPLK